MSQIVHIYLVSILKHSGIERAIYALRIVLEPYSHLYFEFVLSGLQDLFYFETETVDWE